MNNKRDNGAGVRRAAAERKATATVLATATHERELAKAYRGKDKPITTDEAEQALQMLADGFPMDKVSAHFGVTRSAFLRFGAEHTDYGGRLRDAMALGTVSIVNDAVRTAAGEPGFTTGSIERDKLVVDTAWRYAKTIGNRIFGDRLQVDQRTLTITVQKTDDEW